MTHHAVLAAGVERLKDDEQGLPGVGVEKILQLVDALDVPADSCDSCSPV
jgi:hypothetical protein